MGAAAAEAEPDGEAEEATRPPLLLRPPASVELKPGGAMPTDGVRRAADEAAAAAEAEAAAEGVLGLGAAMCSNPGGGGAERRAAAAAAEAGEEAAEEEEGALAAATAATLRATLRVKSEPTWNERRCCGHPNAAAATMLALRRVCTAEECAAQAPKHMDAAASARWLRAGAPVRDAAAAAECAARVRSMMLAVRSMANRTTMEQSETRE